MNKQKKILVLGAGGAMGRYLMPLLAEMNCQVDGLCLPGSGNVPENPAIRYYEGDAKEPAFWDGFLKKGYDGIIDFMIYPTSSLFSRLSRFCNCTDH